MALVSIKGDWYIYFWCLYCKIYASIIWLFGNHCHGTDKVRSVISTGVVGQSASSLQRVRTRRKRTPQQHRSKHVVALTRRPSLRRIVMAPGSSTAHTMMEDKEKVLHGALPTGKSLSISLASLIYSLSCIILVVRQTVYSFVFFTHTYAASKTYLLARNYCLITNFDKDLGQSITLRWKRYWRKFAVSLDFNSYSQQMPSNCCRFHYKIHSYHYRHLGILFINLTSW